MQSNSGTSTPSLTSSGTVSRAPKENKSCIELIEMKLEKKEVFWSFEYFPPKTEPGVTNLYQRFESMSLLNPLFIDVTWGAGGRTSDLTTELCVNAKKFCSLDTQMHLTCTNMPKDKIDQALKDCKENGIRNILALRGDPPVGEKKWTAVEGGFHFASDLVKYIREQYGDYFSIAVAGYPEKHPDSTDYDEDLKHLKYKMDCGADIIITQLFYDVDIFLKFVKDCREIGITAPILPGIMPITNYGAFTRMCEMCKTHIPQQILDDLAPVKENDAAVREYGVKFAIEMCKKMLDNGIYGLHFYTLNQEITTKKILMGLGLISSQELKNPLPWFTPRKGEEQVRPIYWANRPKTYVARTEEWDAFPNGRWGDARSPAFSTLDYYHHSTLYSKSAELRIEEWGEPKSVDDIINVFLRYLDGKISRLPWNDSKLAAESKDIFSQVHHLNKNGFLTVNSQPAVNCAPSDHPSYGWGPSNGFVWQKAYIEFFCSPENLELLKAKFASYPSLSYQAVNKKGEHSQNVTTVSAVTWGAFPNSEIKQPTIVDPEIFLHVWKDEAFALWNSQWGSLYADDSPSRKVIDHIVDSYFLVNIVDNDFTKADNIFQIFLELFPIASQAV